MAVQMLGQTTNSKKMSASRLTGQFAITQLYLPFPEEVGVSGTTRNIWTPARSEGARAGRRGRGGKAEPPTKSAGEFERSASIATSRHKQILTFALAKLIAWVREDTETNAAPTGGIKKARRVRADRGGDDMKARRRVP